MAHMTQLAAMVPPTKHTKQKAPKRIIIFGSVRWVMPKTTDSEQREEKDGAEVSERHESFLPLASEWASTAATTFNKPATTMNLVP